MASKYLYMDKHFKLCCVQRDAQTQSGKYYIALGDKEKHVIAGGKVFYKTVEDAQVVLDALAKDMGWKNV
jgi:hypothetical protein